MTGDEAVADWLKAAWAVQPTLFRAEYEGAAIACRGWNLDRADLPGIILVHGFRAHARWWDHVAPALAEAHRVVALDLSGMGDSDRRPAYSRALHGREIDAAARAAGIARPTVIAHSYGAIASLMLCAAAPERVRRLIIIDSALPTAEDSRLQIPAAPLRTYPDQASAIARFRLMPPGGWPQPDILAYIAEHSVTETADGWGWKFDNDAPLSLNREVYRPHMLGVTVPCDIVYGDRSEIFTAERRARAAEIVAVSGRYIAIPAAHHHVMIEQPLALIAALHALLANDKG
jgi:pimeloyl-ACP methyl ester carboxylesterase